MLHLQVDGMTCGHCVRTVEAAVRAVPGTIDVQVELASGAVDVSGTPDARLVRAAIAEEGYSVTDRR